MNLILGFIAFGILAVPYWLLGVQSAKNDEMERRIKALEEAIFDGPKDQSTMLYKSDNLTGLKNPLYTQGPIDLAEALRLCIPDHPEHKAILHPHNSMIFENMAKAAREFIANERGGQ